jgi:hypothetical protein
MRLIFTVIPALLLASPSLVSGQAAPRVARVLRIEAPKPLLDVCRKWNGKYVFFAHQDGGIKRMADLAGKTLMIAGIDADIGTMMGDATEFLKAAGIDMQLALQNNPEMYDKQFLEKNDTVGFMIASLAGHYKFAQNDKLARIVFVPAKTGAGIPKK